MTWSEIAGLGAVLVSVIGYIVNYYQSKKNTEKNKIEYEKNQAIEMVKLIERIKDIENNHQISIEVNKDLKNAINNLNTTLQSINIKLAEHSIEINNLKEK